MRLTLIRRYRHASGRRNGALNGDGYQIHEVSIRVMLQARLRRSDERSDLSAIPKDDDLH